MFKQELMDPKSLNHSIAGMFTEIIWGLMAWCLWPFYLHILKMPVYT